MNDLTAKPAERQTPIAMLSKTYEGMIDQFENLLPKHVSPQRFKQVVLTAVASMPALASVASTPEGRKSIIMSSLKCASDGLLPDGREAALVPFKNEAAYLPMTRGIITRMQQTGKAKEIGVNLVYSKETFHYSETGDGTEFRHTPILFGDKGELVGAYAFMRTADGGFYVATADVAELDKIANTSKAGNSPWKGPFRSEMQKKSVLKRLAKVAPVSREVMDMLQYDNETFHDLEPIAEKPKMLDRLKEAKAVSHSATSEGQQEMGHAEESEPEVAETVLEGEVVDAAPATPHGTLPILEDRVTAAQAVEYAKQWSGLYKSFDKAARDHFWAQTEDAVDRVGKITGKAQDIISDALNTPAAE